MVIDNGSREPGLKEYLLDLSYKDKIHRLLFNKNGTLPGFQKPSALRQAFELFCMEQDSGDGWAFGFIDNDATVKPGWLATSLQALSGNIYDKGIGCIVPWDRWRGLGEKMTVNGVDIVLRDTSGSLCWLVRPDFFEVFGWPDPDAPSQDEYYVTRFRQLHYRFGILTPPLVFHTGWNDSRWSDRRGKKLPCDSRKVANTII
jgi:hypothetical protein